MTVYLALFWIGLGLWGLGDAIQGHRINTTTTDTD